jgi:membrane protein insertase Oxa1/YidC/SpoIIIJ
MNDNFEHDFVVFIAYGKIWGVPVMLWLIGLLILLNAIVPKLIAKFTYNAESRYYYDTGSPNSAEKGWLFFRRGTFLFLRTAIKLGLAAWIVGGAATLLMVIISLLFDREALSDPLYPGILYPYITSGGIALWVLIYGIGLLVFFLTNLEGKDAHVNYSQKNKLIMISLFAFLFFLVFLPTGFGICVASVIPIVFSIPIIREIVKPKANTGPGNKPETAGDVEEPERKPEW